ncbi:hypothetical protein PFISCL1PPCAC_17887, partial [Pristionchus fissidentatus]
PAARKCYDVTFTTTEVKCSRPDSVIVYSQQILGRNCRRREKRGLTGAPHHHGNEGRSGTPRAPNCGYRQS